MSGTNAHLILEQPPTQPTQPVGTPDTGPDTAVAWPLSARSAPALRDQAVRLGTWLDERPDLARIVT